MPREHTSVPRLPRCKCCGKETPVGERSRGLCISCYNGVKRLIYDGTYTEEFLVSIGVLTPVESVKAWIERLSRKG